MKRLFGFKLLFALLAVVAALPANSAFACAMCYANGNADSPLTQGMNWGIFSLLAVIVCVLATVASFFIYLARKSAAVAAQGESLASTQKA